MGLLEYYLTFLCTHLHFRIRSPEIRSLVNKCNPKVLVCLWIKMQHGWSSYSQSPQFWRIQLIQYSSLASAFSGLELIVSLKTLLFWNVCHLLLISECVFPAVFLYSNRHYRKYLIVFKISSVNVPFRRPYCVEISCTRRRTIRLTLRSMQQQMTAAHTDQYSNRPTWTLLQRCPNINSSVNK